MKDKRIYLKIKVKALAAEARIIRSEERRSRDRYRRQSLAQHRATKLRRASRVTLLAYGFLRGRQYRQIEPTSRRKPDWKRVQVMVANYGRPEGPEVSTLEADKREKEVLEAFAKWREEA